MADRGNFTPLQSRRLPQSVSEASLCPSMDLIALRLGGGDDRGIGAPDGAGGGGNGGVATSVAVYRTVSWQKLLMVQKSDLSSHDSARDEEGGNGGRPSAEQSAATEGDLSAPPNGATALCWSPDGRTVALGLADGGVVQVEASADAGGKGGGGSGSVAARIVPPAPRVAPIAAGEGGEDKVFRYDGASVGRRKKSPPASYATSPAMTRSRAAAMRRQQISKAAGVELCDAKDEDDGAGQQSVSATTEQTGSPDLGWRRGAVTGLVWARVGPKHRLWDLDEEEEEEEEFWRCRTHYLDRAKYFLPPCEYNPRPENDENHPPHHDSNIVVDDTGLSTVDRYQPTSITPLSVLCVATCANGLHLHLHGRYRLLSIPPIASVHDSATNMVCTSDLSTILLFSKTTCPIGHRLVIYSIPSLSQNRYDLQQISASYCSITAHLQTIRKGLVSAAASWTSALRPLDAKFESLAKLLRDYGVLDASTAGDSAASAAGVRAQLLRFALVGHSSQNGDASNAMDQFFAAATMNDQLLVRLERTLEANVAGVEGTLRKSVLGPVRALVHDAHELRGLSSAMGAGRTKVWDDDGSDEDSSGFGCAPLLDLRVAHSFCDATESLFVILERSLSMLVDARFRLRDVMKWIRGTASQVKARGTAVDSVMRENARKRRVPDAVVKRLANFLSPAFFLKLPENGYKANRNAKMTEQVLGVPLSLFFSEDESSSHAVSAASYKGMPPSNGCQTSVGDRMDHKQVSALSALSSSSHSAAELFDQPRNAIALAVGKIDIISSSFGNIPSGIRTIPSFAVHRRVGAGSTSDSSNTRRKFFSPKVIHSCALRVAQERHWTLVAFSGSAGGLPFADYLQIVAIPSERNSAPGNPPPFFLVSSVSLPKGSTIADLEFYGDDGCSSLSSATDRQDHEEGRQALGVLLECASTGEDEYADASQLRCVSEELWILPYDDLPFKFVRCGPSRSIQIPNVEMTSCSITWAEDGSLIVNDTESHLPNTIDIRRRQTRERAQPRGANTPDIKEPVGKSRLVLSGSRGIGGVVSSPGSVELFDLEEDEEKEASGSFDGNSHNMSA